MDLRDRMFRLLEAVDRLDETKYPVGTVRTWADGEFFKTANGWLPVPKKNQFPKGPAKKVIDAPNGPSKPASKATADVVKKSADTFTKAVASVEKHMDPKGVADVIKAIGSEAANIFDNPGRFPEMADDFAKEVLKLPALRGSAQGQANGLKLLKSAAEKLRQASTATEPDKEKAREALLDLHTGASIMVVPTDAGGDWSWHKSTVGSALRGLK